MNFCWTALLEIGLFSDLNCVLIPNWIAWNRTVYGIKIDLALDNHQMLICNQTPKKPTNKQTTMLNVLVLFYMCISVPSFIYALCIYQREIQTLVFDKDSKRCPWCNGYWRCPWCNCYRRRMWTRRHEFKSWTSLITFHIALIALGKVWIQIFSLQLWVNSRAD